MRVVISGGSNSVRKRGWTADLAQSLPAGAEIVNLSVGGATSTMGAWRVMAAGQLGPGDVLVWEYAVNDRNHIGPHGSRAETLLRHVEHVICAALEAGARMLAVGLVSQQQAAAGADGYVTGLRALFAYYGVPFWDGHAPLPGGSLAAADFDDPNHVAAGGRVIAAVVDWMRARLAEPAAVGGVLLPPLRRGGRRLVAMEGFSPDRAEPFRNGLVDLPVRRVPGGKAGLTVTHTLGDRVEVQGLAILAARKGGVLRIAAGGAVRFVATGLHDEKRDVLLRFLSLEATGGVPVLGPGEAMRLTWGLPRVAAMALRLPGRLGQVAARVAGHLPGAATVRRDVGFSPRIQRNPGPQGGSRIAAVLGETL